MGRRVGTGDMLTSVYDPNEDGVIAVAQTQADMVKATYDPVIAAIQALAAAHKTQHQNGGTDEINATGLTGVPVAPLLADGVAGRVFRELMITIDNGSNDQTLKCSTINRFNHTPISTVDNIAKGATTGGFTLDAQGQTLLIEAAVLEGNVVFAVPSVLINYNTARALPYVFALSNDIQVKIASDVGGTIKDITAFVDAGRIVIAIPYITNP